MTGPVAEASLGDPPIWCPSPFRCQGVVVDFDGTALVGPDQEVLVHQHLGLPCVLFLSGFQTSKAVMQHSTTCKNSGMLVLNCDIKISQGSTIILR
jgi:hypothetical protein